MKSYKPGQQNKGCYTESWQNEQMPDKDTGSNKIS